MLKILVADDSAVVRRLLKTALSGEPGWSLCGEAVNGQQAMLLAHQLKPDIVVMDLAMPLLDGLRASAEILKLAPALPIVLYTLHNTPELTLEAKKVGIKAVVAKSDDMNVLLEAVRRVAAETAPTSPLAALSNELFTTVAGHETPEASSVVAPTERAEEFVGDVAAATPNAELQTETRGDTTAEVEPPSNKVSENPPGVS